MNLTKPFSHILKIAALPISLAALSLLQSCTEKEVVPQFTADPAAFDYAVSETAEMQLYVQECSKLGADLQKMASEAQTAWYQRNWPEAQVADASYSQKLAAQTLTYNNERVALPAIKLYASLEKEIKLRLDQTRHSHSNVVDYCSRKLASYKEGTMDLSRNKNADLYLKSLASNTASAPFKIPSLSGSLVVNNDPGRSQFNLEKTLNEQGCTDSEILTLRNDWPYEVYGAFCGGSDKTIFVTCEWGECKSQ